MTGPGSRGAAQGRATPPNPWAPGRILRVLFLAVALPVAIWLVRASVRVPSNERAWGIVLPGFSDALALDRGLLDVALPLDEARARHRVDGRVRAALATGAGDFGVRIRQGGGGGT